ncbi:hypothetical protein AAC387_Pa05g0849 [Persea americana]
MVCRLQGYDAETAIAIIIDASVSLKIDTQHLRGINFRIGSIYQFIGELLIQSDNNWILCGSNVTKLLQTLGPMAS